MCGQVLKTRRLEGTLVAATVETLQRKGQPAQEYYELGSLLLDKKLYTQAALYLQQALKNMPKEEADNAAMVYNALGYALLCPGPNSTWPSAITKKPSKLIPNMLRP